MTQKTQKRAKGFTERYSPDARRFIWELHDLERYQPYIILVHPTTGRRQHLIVRNDGFHVN